MNPSRLDLGVRCALTLLLLVCLFPPEAGAQVVGARLEGIVKDASQAVIPGVTVTATNEGTGISYTGLTNDTGFYVFVNLPPGSYALTCELQGFKRYVNKGILLKVGDAVSINIVLETGDIQTEVVVTAAASLIDLTSNKIGAVVQERQIMDLPLNGRNPLDLFLLQPGASPLGGGSVTGLRTNANNTKVEGIWASDASFDSAPTFSAAPVPLEAVGEYRVTTSSASAESGRGSGAMVSVVYKSGTNSFHGSVYEFNRNTVYNANNFFTNKQGQPRPVFLRNQFGASIGGPIVKNKTFFFFNYEGQRQIQANIVNRNVFTEPVRRGIFRYYTKGANSSSLVDANGVPTVPASDIGTIDLFSVDATRLGFDSSGIVAAKLKQIPLPNNYRLGDGLNLAGYQYTCSIPTPVNQFITKIDHNLSVKHQLTFSLGWSKTSSPGNTLFSGYPENFWEQARRFLSIGWVSSLLPNLTNEFRAGATRFTSDWYMPNPAHADPKGNFQLISLGTGRGGQPNGNPLAVFLPQFTPTDAFTWSDNIAWVVKNHTIKFGLEVAHSYSNYKFGGDEYIPVIYPTNSYNPANVPSLPGLNSTDRGRAQQLVNDLTGTIGYINQTYNANTVDKFLPYDTRHRLTNQRQYGAFFQDTWKFAENLTLNLGVRWDILPAGYMKNGIFSYPVDGALSVYGISGPRGKTDFGPAPDRGKGTMATDWNNLGPNVGLTWDPFKNGKMSVSANYRVAYDRVMIAVTNRLDDMNQGLSTTLTVTPFVRFSDPNLYQEVGGKPPILPLPNPGKPFAPLPFERYGRGYAFNEGTKTPYTQNWSLRIQRELFKDWYIQTSYVGNISVGGWRAININQIEIRKNGFLAGFQAAQRNLAANKNPNIGEDIGVLKQLFAPLGGIPSSLNTAISQGQAATVADWADTTSQGTGKRGGLITAAGLPITFFRANPQLLNANIGDNLSVSTWHGMMLEVGKRFSGGSFLQFNYTLGKGLTDYTGGQGLYDDFRDNENRRLDKRLQTFDSTHIIQATGIYELPFGRNKRWLSAAPTWQDLLFGGWQLNGIFSLATSRPFTISTGRYTLTLNDDATADYSGKDFNIASKVIKGDYIYAITPEEKALFSYPAAGSPGGTPQYMFRGPLYTNIDTSLFKNFRAPFLGEQGQIQFRTEAFNVLNHPNFNLPTSSIASGSFGQITSARAERILQFALKILF